MGGKHQSSSRGEECESSLSHTCVAARKPTGTQTVTEKAREGKDRAMRGPRWPHDVEGGKGNDTKPRLCIPRTHMHARVYKLGGSA